MVKVELYVPGIKGKEMVEIAHGEIVEGSRGKRHRLYGTYTDPVTKKIHKANSFVSKDKYDKAVAEMTAGMPVADIDITQVSIFAEDSPVSAEPSDLGGLTEPDNAGVPADVGGDEPVPMGDEPSDIEAFEAEKKNCGCGKDPCVTYGADTDVGTTIDDIIMDEYVDEGEALDDAEDYARKARRALTEREAEADLTGIIVQDNDPSSPPEGIFATEQEREMEDSARKKEYGYTHSTMDDYRPELDDSSFVEEIDESALYEYEMEQERLRENPVETQDEVVVEIPTTPEIEETVVETTTGPEPGTWASIAFDMAMMSDDDDDFDWNAWKDEMKENQGAEGYEAYRKRAEMTLREWGESELEEEKHDFSENPNESFREWIDEEVKAHGDISFKDWAEEEESEELSAETYSADTMMDSETMDTQIAVAIGIPPEIWLTMSRQKQDAYIASMDLDVERVREMAETEGPQSIMWLANNQKENVTHGDLSLIDCNVCGISASQLLGERGGVCDITDPNAGANPNYIRGVSCPFEKYYSLTRAVYDAVEEDLAENRTVIQLITPRPAAFAAESTTSRVSKFASAMDTFDGQRVSKSETLMDITKDTSIGDFTNKELTESSAIQGDFDHASLNFSGRQNIQARAESQSFQADLEPQWHKRTHPDNPNRFYYSKGHRGEYTKEDKKHGAYGSRLGRDGVWNELQNKRGMGFDNHTGELVKLPLQYYDDFMNNSETDAETFRAYDDAISDRQRYKIQELGGKVDSSMNRSEASDYIKELQGSESGTWREAETFNSDSWDDLYVVAENQWSGWEACDVTDGVLQTYANQADAEREAQMTIDDLNSMGGDYGPTSWAGKRLSEVDVADNVEFIRYPNGLEAPYDEVHQGQSLNTGRHLEATRGIDTFAEPFESGEEGEKSNLLIAAGIAGLFALGAWLLPKGD